MTKVEYRIMPGYGGAYRVGDDGSVWSRKITNSKVLGEWRKKKPSILGMKQRGRPTVCKVKLHQFGRQMFRSVHHLVLEAFVSKRPAGMECRHLNGDPTDNRLCNLAWGTSKENCQDALRQGTRMVGSRHHSAKLSLKKVLAIRELRKMGVPCAYLAKQYGVGLTAIKQAASGKTWKGTGE